MKSRLSVTHPPRQYPYFPLMMLIHGSSAFMDAAIAVTLASSALFTVDVHQARFSILMSLIGTLIPFILLAPTASMLVTKIKTPRIVVAISINAIRVVGLILMAIASSHSSSTRLAIFPLAFIMLTLSKCYVVAKTSALPQITTPATFPYFSSRLSMTTGVLSVVAGALLFALNRLFSEWATLYFAAFVSIAVTVMCVISYLRLGKRVREGTIDADMDGARDLALASLPDSTSDLSPRNRARAVKSLFTYSSAIRFAVGAVTIGVGLNYRKHEFILALCFIGAAVASFAMNALAVVLNRTRLAPFINYLVVAGFAASALLLVLSSSSLVFILVSAVLGGVSAYSRVVYESKAAHIIPHEFSARLLARGEVWMQLLWVVGAACAVISYRATFLGVICVLAAALAIWAYVSTTKALKKTTERF